MILGSPCIHRLGGNVQTGFHCKILPQWIENYWLLSVLLLLGFSSFSIQLIFFLVFIGFFVWSVVLHNSPVSVPGKKGLIVYYKMVERKANMMKTLWLLQPWSSISSQSLRRNFCGYWWYCILLIRFIFDFSGW